MLVSGVTSSTILDNQVLNNHTDGIEVVLYSNNNYMAANVVTGQGGTGIAGSTSSGLNIHDNTVEDSGSSGIFLLQAQGNWIQYNTVYGNDAQGIDLSQSSPDSVDLNVVEHNFGDGIDDGHDAGTASSHNEFSNNTIESNGFLPNGQQNQSQGMLLSGATYAVVYDNTVSGNHTDGIEVVLSSTGTLVSDNTVDGNGGDGIAVNSTNTGTVEYNNLNDNGADGIHLIGDTDMSIYDSTVINSKPAVATRHLGRNDARIGSPSPFRLLGSSLTRSTRNLTFERLYLLGKLIQLVGASKVFMCLDQPAGFIPMVPSMAQFVMSPSGVWQRASQYSAKAR